MTPPRRIQRRRIAGWRMPDGCRFVGRPTVFGNPFKVFPPIRGHDQFSVCDIDGRTVYALTSSKADAHAYSVLLYRSWLTTGTLTGAGARKPMRGHWWQRAEILRHLPELRGRDLCCWCAPEFACHIDVLLDLANGDALVHS